MPLTEELPTDQAASPYGRSKVMVETILRDHCAASHSFSATVLRYFNPIGADERYTRSRSCLDSMIEGSDRM